MAEQTFMEMAEERDTALTELGKIETWLAANPDIDFDFDNPEGTAADKAVEMLTACVGKLAPPVGPDVDVPPA